MFKLLAGLTRGAQQGRPVFEVGSKDLLDHAVRQFGDDAVQHHWRETFFIGEPGPVQIVRIPGLSQESARVPHKRGERTQVQQLARVALR